MKIYLHIGLHKTGTTTLQQFASQKRAHLLKNGIFWPEGTVVFGSNQHSLLAHWVKEGRLSEVKAFIGAAVADATKAGAHSVLISGEALSTLTAEQARTFADLMPGHELELILYLRNIYDKALSALKFRMRRNDKVLPIERLIHPVRNGYSYRDIVEHWAPVVPAERFHIVCYDTVKADLVGSFCECLGIAPPEGKPVANYNIGLDISTQLWLTSSGYSEDSTVFARVRLLYQDIFSGMRFKAPGDELVKTALCPERTRDMDHPLLAPHREVLLKAPLAPEEQDIDGLIDYLDRMNRFTRKLARMKKRQRFRSRLRARLPFLARWIKG